MQQVQNCLDFPIDTPSDAEVRERFQDEMRGHSFFEKHKKVKRKIVFKNLNGLTKNQKKRARKAKA